MATITSKIGTSLFAKPEIKTVEGLKGKTLATGRPAAFLDATVRYVLRSKFGLIPPDRDVNLLPTGEPYLGLQALERGIVDAAAMSITHLFIARSGLQGIGKFRQTRRRISLYERGGVAQTAAKSPDLIERFIKCIVEGIHIFKTDKAKSLAVLRLYMKGADEGILEEAYQHTRGTIDDAPHPSLQVVNGGLEMLSLQYPQTKQTDASLIIEPTFMKRIDESGFVRALYKRNV